MRPLSTSNRARLDLPPARRSMRAATSGGALAAAALCLLGAAASQPAACAAQAQEPQAPGVAPPALHPLTVHAPWPVHNALEALGELHLDGSPLGEPRRGARCVRARRAPAHTFASRCAFFKSVCGRGRLPGCCSAPSAPVTARGAYTNCAAKPCVSCGRARSASGAGV